MALVTELVIQSAVGEVSITYDDANLVGDDPSACDLDHVRVIVNTGFTARILIRRGESDNFQDRTIVGPADETYNAGGPVQVVEDLDGYTFGGA